MDQKSSRTFRCTLVPSTPLPPLVARGERFLPKPPWPFLSPMPCSATPAWHRRSARGPWRFRSISTRAAAHRRFLHPHGPPLPAISVPRGPSSPLEAARPSLDHAWPRRCRVNVQVRSAEGPVIQADSSQGNKCAHLYAELAKPLGENRRL
jgi:hypothetical protein